MIIGGGPAGVQAATVASRLGAQVTLIEREVIGGAAHLWDCIPSKAMIATSGALGQFGNAAGMGLSSTSAVVELEVLRERIASIVTRLERGSRELLESQNVDLVRGIGRLVDARTVVAETGSGEVAFEADAILVSTGSRPLIPDWAEPDGDRVLTTRNAYPPKELPSHIVVVGSGVTGVEFVHMFSSLGSEVSLVISRQQVLPAKDPEVAAVLENDFLRRGVHMLKGARAIGVDRTVEGVVVRCADGRSVSGSHELIRAMRISSCAHPSPSCAPN